MWKIFFEHSGKFSEVDRDRFMALYSVALVDPARVEPGGAVFLNFLSRKYKLGVPHIETKFKGRI